MKIKSQTESDSKTNKPSNQFEKFRAFAQKLVNVPKKEIDEQEKIYQMKKEKAKS